MVKSITNYSPQSKDDEWIYIKDKLADPSYTKPGKINALLGTWIKIVEPEILKSSTNNAMAQKTKLGYVIFKTSEDPYQLQQPYVGSITAQESTEELIKQIQKLWELESMEKRSFSTNEEKQCEEIFRNRHTRDKLGRYVVRIPFNDQLPNSGKSKSTALRQFFAMETKMKNNAEFGKQYKQFMTEYLQLGYMERISESIEDGYYTPHHAVLTADKFRTVFNASAKTSTGVTLNDAQMFGEKLQQDLFFTLMNFRRHNYGVIADIEKIYKQIKTAMSDSESVEFMEESTEWDSDFEPTYKTIINAVTDSSDAITLDGNESARETHREMCAGKEENPLACSTCL